MIPELVPALLWSGPRGCLLLGGSGPRGCLLWQEPGRDPLDG